MSSHPKVPNTRQNTQTTHHSPGPMDSHPPSLNGSQNPTKDLSSIPHHMDQQENTYKKPTTTAKADYKNSRKKPEYTKTPTTSLTQDTLLHAEITTKKGGTIQLTSTFPQFKPPPHPHPRQPRAPMSNNTSETCTHSLKPYTRASHNTMKTSRQKLQKQSNKDNFTQEPMATATHEPYYSKPPVTSPTTATAPTPK
jgi:hypothetical protein